MPNANTKTEKEEKIKSEKRDNQQKCSGNETQRKQTTSVKTTRRIKIISQYRMINKKTKEDQK